MSVPLPSLPGYKARGPNRTIRYKPTSEVKPEVQKSHRITKFQYSQDENVVLTFQGYFIELFNNTDRPRSCQLSFFVKTGEISVVLRPQASSGIPQGTRVRRAQYTKPDGDVYTSRDLDVGQSVIIGDTTYFLVDCDHETRDYLYRSSVSLSQELNASSVYTDLRTTSGSTFDEWGYFHSKRNANKTFLEAQLGNTVDNSGREGFLRYGGRVLKFRLRSHEPNEDDLVTEFSMVYRLADDTVEIFALADYNGNRNGFSKLLRRSRLPRGLETLSLLRPEGAEGEVSYYHWTDFYIGLVLNVYSRHLRIVDADASARAAYAEIECALGDAELEDEAPPPQTERVIPPPTGFGSEEDSLRSCVGSLLARAPVVKAVGENKAYNFRARLMNGGPDDTDRDFFVSYFFSDCTVKITEPPKRNSGFVGGTFLARRKVHTASGEPITEKYFFVGCRLTVSHHEFLLEEADERTLKDMEAAGRSVASTTAVLGKIKEALRPPASDGSLLEAFRRLDLGERGFVSQSALAEVLSSFGLIVDAVKEEEERFCFHELLTLVRGFGIGRVGQLDYRALIDQLLL